MAYLPGDIPTVTALNNVRQFRYRLFTLAVSRNLTTPSPCGEEFGGEVNAPGMSQITNETALIRYLRGDSLKLTGSPCTTGRVTHLFYRKLKSMSAFAMNRFAMRERVASQQRRRNESAPFRTSTRNTRTSTGGHRLMERDATERKRSKNECPSPPVSAVRTRVLHRFADSRVDWIARHL
jgi:hypothetical protein